jgi:hypothetical protein
MNGNGYEYLAKRWQKLKRLEDKIQDARRTVEDTMLANFPTGKRSLTFTLFDYPKKYHISYSLPETVKVNGDLLQELANIHGVENELTRLFRWKPELEKAAWKTAPSDVKEKLSPAISTKIGRPSFKIEEEKY